MGWFFCVLMVLSNLSRVFAIDTGANLTELIHGFALFTQASGDIGGDFGGDHQNKADATVERAVHFGGCDVACTLQPSEQFGHTPCIGMDLCGAVIGQDAGDVFA